MLPSMCTSSAFAAALVLLSATSLDAAVPATTVDKSFAAKVSQGGTYEVEAGKLAEAKATAQDVKDLANMDVHDHTFVNGKLKKIAAANHVPVASQLNSEFTERLTKLKAISGIAFDSAYVSDMQGIHDKDEKLFAQEASEGSGDFKEFAAETDSIVKRHIGALNAK